MDIYAHLLSRHFSTNCKVWLSDSTATFPLYNFQGKLVGYQQYRPLGTKTARKNPKLGKYFTYSSEPSVWGLNCLPFNGKLVICEGIFKACRFIANGIPAIATLTNNPKHLKQQLELLSLTTSLIAVPDPDKAGMKLIKYGTQCVIPHKPVDELSEQELQYLCTRIKEM